MELSFAVILFSFYLKSDAIIIKITVSNKETMSHWHEQNSEEYQSPIKRIDHENRKITFKTKDELNSNTIELLQICNM